MWVDALQGCVAIHVFSRNYLDRNHRGCIFGSKLPLPNKECISLQDASVDGVSELIEISKIGKAL
jgi:hypothetical protein